MTITIDELAKILLEEVADLTQQLEQYDENDSFHDYLEGTIAARQVVLTRIGVPMEVAY